jgi:MFS transporter, putative metabolite:H+ symporter
MSERQPTNNVSVMEPPSHDRLAAPAVESLTAGAKDGFYTSALNLAVVIAGLGYFVDTFDFFLYNGMRVVSLTELGLSGDALTKVGILILNCQIFGALIGSFIWGMMGDKVGRKKAMLASIFIYSLAMLANAFVHDPTSYGIVRFIIGFGVAGEVGLGATLIAETINSSKRTYALMFFTIMGLMGVAVAGASIEFVSWRISCIAGGIFGLLLLTLRSFLFESRLFVEKARSTIQRGSLKELFGKAQSLKKYLLCVPLLGCNFFVTGVLMTLSPEIAKATGAHEAIKANIALGIYFFAAVFGDWLGAWLSDTFKSRRLVAGLFILGNMCLAFLFLQKLGLNAVNFYALCAAFGMFNLWAISGTIVVEQFPTELRATATTSNFNCSRAAVILMNMAFLMLKPIGVSNGLMIVGAVVFALGIFCVWRLPETYGRSLSEMS